MPAKFRLVIRREAEADILEARSWYDLESEALGDRFLDTLNARLATLLTKPNLWPDVGKGVRQATVKDFPYSVYCIAYQHRLTVVAVQHHRRDPLVWRRRVGLNEPAGPHTATGVT